MVKIVFENKSNFTKFKKFDCIIISFPSKHNLTNFILANIIEQVKPKLIAKVLFKEVPISIIVNKEIFAPSIDFYYKKIKNKKYLFVIGNYKPKNIEFYRKLYKIINKGEEIVFLNEFTGIKEEMVYLRKEFKKPRINLSNLDKFKEVNNAVIKGIPSLIFESAKKNKKNITLLFFNINSEVIDEGLTIIEEIIENDYKANIGEIEEFIDKIKTRNNKKEKIKIKYVG